MINNENCLRPLKRYKKFIGNFYIFSYKYSLETSFSTSRFVENVPNTNVLHWEIFQGIYSLHRNLILNNIITTNIVGTLFKILHGTRNYVEIQFTKLMLSKTFFLWRILQSNNTKFCYLCIWSEFASGMEDFNFFVY